MYQGAEDGLHLFSCEFVEPIPRFQFFQVFGLLGGYLNGFGFEVLEETEISKKGVEWSCLGMFPWPAEGLCNGVNGINIIGV